MEEIPFCSFSLINLHRLINAVCDVDSLESHPRAQRQQDMIEGERQNIQNERERER